MASELMAWLPHSPFRNPAWRWARACWLVEREAPLDQRMDDEWVARAHSFMRADARSTPPDHRPQWSEHDFVIQQAMALSREEPPHRRWHVEALLLTPEPLEGIASRTGLSAAVADAYHALFFDVRLHLDAIDWIRRQAIGSGPWNHFAGAQPGGYWKYAAFTGGVQMLELLIALTLDLPFPDWFQAPAGRDAAYQEERVRLLGKLTLRLMSARSPAEVDAVVEARSRIDSLDRQATVEVKPRGDVTQVMEQFLQGLNPRRRRRACKGTPTIPSPVSLLSLAKATPEAPQRRPHFLPVK